MKNRNPKLRPLQLDVSPQSVRKAKRIKRFFKRSVSALFADWIEETWQKNGQKIEKLERDLGLPKLMV